MKSFVGIDVSKSRLDVCVLASKEHYYEIANNSPSIRSFISKIKKHALSASIVCEASGGYEQRLVKMLRDANIPVHILNPTKSYHFRKSHAQAQAKTDKIDALMLARYAQEREPKSTEMQYSIGQECLAALLKRRSDLLRTKSKETNRLDKDISPQIVTLIKQHIAFIDEQIEVVESEITSGLKKKYHNEQSAINLLCSVPGIGFWSALTLVCRVPFLGKTGNKAVSKFVGVAPINHDSGRYVGKCFISGGNKEVRNVLYMATLSAIRHNPLVREFYERLRRNGKPHKVAYIAGMRKLLTVCNSVMKRRAPWHN